eukprot:CAMPEP_0202489816 /NCGR_PEP_ID=MMETSP1361-20130828/7426_1 /ASSEMBLY_ACC=CAM_ASM_000849 /TAXON_ID=210615 /ORGANISM="Staurosira complex sp., Strain CCMP2646" /LENGTH=229 /DNA_ID=CAMNT_0049119613 /DNA_START=1070 /DNA_END=1762 /DNA_ORIENTATION=-
MTSDFTMRPAWDFPKMQRFGRRRLTPSFLWEFMEGIKEPMTNIWACGFLFLVACMLTPLVPENEPPFDEQNGEFVYEPAPSFNGLPWWAYKIILLGIIPTVALVGMACCLPDSFEPDDEKIMKDGLAPDAVIMTTPEWAVVRRTQHFDPPSSYTIASRMENLNMVRLHPPPVVNDSGRRRLSALAVKGETVPESESDVSNEAESAGSPAKEVANEESNVAEEEAVEVEN